MSKCAAFYKHTNVRSGNRIFPCCRYKKSVAIFDGNLNKILNLPEMQRLREIPVEDNPNCEKCMHEESLGKNSLRQRFNLEYDIQNVKLEYLEIGFDNICNAACDGCYSEFSSTWSKILDPLSKNHIISSDEIISIPDTVVKILFLGGEPLMTNRHKRLLEMVNDLSKVNVIYNTNGTFILDKKTIKLLKNCKSVEFILSIDGYDKLNELVRKNCKWSKIQNFIKQIKTQEYKLSINTVLHKNNYHGLSDLENYIKNLKNVNWTVNILTHPATLDIRTVKDKQKVIDCIMKTTITNKSHRHGLTKEALINYVNRKSI